MSWMDDEPVRGSFPPVELLALPGIERVFPRVRDLTPPPPTHHLVGMRPTDGGLGWSQFEMPAHPWLQTSAGMFLAGTAALVADAPLGAAILSTLEPGVFGVTSELSMSFLRPAGVESQTLKARTKVIDVGRTLGLSEATVEDANGKLLAHSTSRYYLRSFDINGMKKPEPVPTPTYDTPDPYQRPLTVPVQPDLFLEMSGLDYFRAVAKGALPPSPFAELFGIVARDADEGRVTSTVRASKWLLSPARTIYGGILAYLADAAMTAAVGTLLPKASSCATLDFKIYFLRPGIADDRELTINGSVVHKGKTIAVTQAEILNADGKAIVVASGSSMMLPGKPWRSVAVADEVTADED